MNEPRFYIDHGMIHDRGTGKHVTTAPDDETWNGQTISHTLALLNELSHRAAAGREDFEIARIAVRDHWVDGCARCCKVEEPGRYEGDCSCGNISALVVRALKKGQS